MGEEPPYALDLGGASALLDVARQALEETVREDLEPSDMLSLVQLLAAAAEVPVVAAVAEGNRSRCDAQELSQHFISVADVRKKVKQVEKMLNPALGNTRLSNATAHEALETATAAANVRLRVRGQRGLWECCPLKIGSLF